MNHLALICLENIHTMFRVGSISLQRHKWVDNYLDKQFDNGPQIINCDKLVWEGHIENGVTFTAYYRDGTTEYVSYVGPYILIDKGEPSEI